MSSSTIFRLAGTLFFIIVPAHTHMAFDVIYPGLRSLPADNNAAYSAKTIWNEANGYFIASGLLCLVWADRGIPSTGLERYVLGALIGTHGWAGTMYLLRKMWGPASLLLAVSVLMGVAGAKEIIR